MTTDVFKQINAFAYQVVRQSNTRHLSWQQQFAGRMQSEIITLMGVSVPPLLSAAIAQHAAATAREDECYLIIFKSIYTEQIARIDDERDTKYVGLKAMAEALSRIGTPTQQEYSNLLLDLAAHYKVDIKERYDDETTKMSQFLQVLQAPEWTPRITALGLTATVAELVSLNQQMKALIEERNNEQATLMPQAMLTARAAADEAYTLVVTIINALAVAEWADGSSPYDQAIARINQDQDYYAKQVFSGTTPSTGGNAGGTSGNSGNSGNTGNNEPTNPNEPSNPNEPINPGGDTPGTGGETPSGGDNGGGTSGGSGDGGGGGGGGSTGNGQGEDE